MGVDGAVAAAEAQAGDLAVQLLDAGAPLVPPLVQVRLAVIEFARPPGQRARRHLAGAAGVVVAAGGARCQAELPGDRRDVLALGLQRLHLVIALPGLDHTRPVLRVGCGRLPGRLTGIGRLLRGGLLENGVPFLDAPVAVSDGLHCVFAQVVPQMPAVRDLDRVWRAVRGSQRVGAGPVPADHLHAGVLPQPPGEGAGLPVVEHVDGLAGIHVDQQGRIRVPASFREIIHAQHGDLADPGVGKICNISVRTSMSRDLADRADRALTRPGMSTAQGNRRRTPYAVGTTSSQSSTRASSFSRTWSVLRIETRSSWVFHQPRV